MFADALYGDGTAGSGDKAKLFKDMENGKVGLKELTKVIEYMGKLTQPDLLAQMLNTPEKKLQRLKTQWILTMEQMNDSGFLDLMGAAFEEFTKLLVDATKWLVANKKEVKEWMDSFVKAFRWMFDNIPILVGVWASFKLAAWLNAAVIGMRVATAAGVALNTQLTAMALRFMAIPLFIFAVGAAFIELKDTFEGENTWLKLVSENPDKGFLGWLATLTRSFADLGAVLGSIPLGLVEMLWGVLTLNPKLIKEGFDKPSLMISQAMINQNAMSQDQGLFGMGLGGGTKAAQLDAMVRSSPAMSWSSPQGKYVNNTARTSDVPYVQIPNVTINMNGVNADEEKLASMVQAGFNDIVLKAASNYQSQGKP